MRNAAQIDFFFFPLTEEKCEDSGSRNQLRFSQFNISQVLKHGASLLGSEGAEYDLAEDIGKVLPLLPLQCTSKSYRKALQTPSKCCFPVNEVAVDL